MVKTVLRGGKKEKTQTGVQPQAKFRLWFLVEKKDMKHIGCLGYKTTALRSWVGIAWTSRPKKVKLLARPDELQSGEKRPTSISGARNLIYWQGFITEKTIRNVITTLASEL